MFTPNSRANRMHTVMDRTSPACPPHAIFADVMQRINARVREIGSPSPRSQFKSSFMSIPSAALSHPTYSRCLKADVLARATLGQPPHIGGIEHTKLGIPAYRWAVA